MCPHLGQKVDTTSCSAPRPTTGAGETRCHPFQPAGNQSVGADRNQAALDRRDHDEVSGEAGEPAMPFDRSQEHAAQARGEQYDPYRYATPETVTLTPLPCLEHLAPEEYRRRVAALWKRSRRRLPLIVLGKESRWWLQIAGGTG